VNKGYSNISTVKTKSIKRNKKGMVDLSGRVLGSVWFRCSGVDSRCRVAVLAGGVAAEEKAASVGAGDDTAQWEKETVREGAGNCLW
jgi:hypothetical protein